jgi:hypothetical protein
MGTIGQERREEGRGEGGKKFEEWWEDRRVGTLGI